MANRLIESVGTDPDRGPPQVVFADVHCIERAVPSVLAFGDDVSPGNRIVLELVLRGDGADTSAERLDISLETVRRHRKSIYKKLDVSCQADLFALFINSMPYIGEANGNDPLSVYMN